MKCMIPALLVLSLTVFGCSDSVLYKVSDDSKPEIFVHPEHIDFGNLVAGQESGLEDILIINAGDADLIFASPELFDGSTRFNIDFHENEITLKPQESYIVDINYIPETFEHNGAFVRITSNDEESQIIDVLIEGMGDAPVMTITPEIFDYGYIDIGCDNEERITIRNDGNLDLTIESVNQMVTLPADIILEFGSLPEPPWQLIPTQEVDFLVSYIPNDVGYDESMITIVGNDPNNPSVKSLQYGEGDVEKWITQQWIQEQIPILDVLWVVDNSGSMGPFQLGLSNNIGSFMSTFAASGTDYHMSVITTDSYLFSTIIDGSTQNSEQLLSSLVITGITGSGMEKGIDMASRSLSTAAAAGRGGNFFREDSKLIVIFVSDEPDFSASGWASYIPFFDSIKPAGSFIPYGIIGDVPGGCTIQWNSTIRAATEGLGYWDLIEYYSGNWYSICANDWGLQLQDLAGEVTGRRMFVLEEDPIIDTIEVYVNGQMTSDWEYDEDENCVVFSSGNMPEEGQTIEITYAIWGCGE